MEIHKAFLFFRVCPNKIWIHKRQGSFMNQRLQKYKAHLTTLRFAVSYFSLFVATTDVCYQRNITKPANPFGALSDRFSKPFSVIKQFLFLARCMLLYDIEVQTIIMYQHEYYMKDGIMNIRKKLKIYKYYAFKCSTLHLFSNF